MSKSKLEVPATPGVKYKDVGFALGFVLVLAMLFIPLPSFLLDAGLALSISISVLILMVALWVPRPLDFNSFPTLLLMVTMLRLALNISSTRLILSEGHTGTDAAGGVIEGFSQFIVGGDYVIGVIIFAILVVINFMVITKGATRIAEVSARFTLDAIPGKQMAIDADLGAGIIDEQEAKQRREDLNNESSFFGAMDGASKFVRGDAVAGIIITLINIVGGIIIGVAQKDMTLAAAASNYTVLTIGDGLVSQIPALVVSLAAGMIVTKGSTKGAANEAVIGQLGNHPKAMYMAAALLFFVGLLPGFPFLIFTFLSGGMAAIAYTVTKKKLEQERLAKIAEQEANDPNTSFAEETPQEILKIDDLRVDLGGALIPMIASMDAALPGKVRSLRKLFAEQYGFILPFVRIKDSAMIEANQYTINVQGVRVAEGMIRPNAMLVIVPGGVDVPIAGERTKEPTFGLDAIWIDPNLADEAERLGLTVVDPESVITTHLTEIITEHMSALMTYGSTKSLVDNMDREYQKLVSDLTSQGSPVVLLQRVLQNLLAERVSIRNLPLVVESVTEALTMSTNISAITEHVRQKLSNQICQSLADENGYLPVIVMSAQWEEEFIRSVQMKGDEPNFLMTPQRVHEFLIEARKEIHKFAAEEQWPAIMVAPQVRTFVRSMLERVSPLTQVISHNEIYRKTPLKTVATIGG